MDGWIDWIVSSVIAMVAIMFESKFPFKVKSKWLRIGLIVILSLMVGIITSVILHIISKKLVHQ